MSRSIMNLRDFPLEFGKKEVMIILPALVRFDPCLLPNKTKSESCRCL